MADRWAAASTYERFMGRWSRQIAPRFVSWLQVPPGAHWLDVGCGTGSLASAICRDARPASVVGCDPSGPFVEYARQHSAVEPVSFVIAGIGSLPTRPGGFGAVTSLFALNFFPDPTSSIEEMVSVAASGGSVSACVWDYAGHMDYLRIFWDVASRLDPAALELDEGERFPICEPDALVRLFREAGLGAVSHAAIEIATEFSSFEEYWKPFLGGTGPAPSYVASLEDEVRSSLAGELRRALPIHHDGTITLVAQAWAVRGSTG